MIDCTNYWYKALCEWILENWPCMHKNWNPFQYNNHTQVLSRHGEDTAIDNQVCFFDGFLMTLSSRENNKTDPVGATEGH